MEEMQRAREGDGAQSFPALPGHAPLQVTRCVQHRTSLNPVLLGFMGVSLHKHD